MILSSNTNSVWSHLLECDLISFEPLASGNLQHLMLITTLFLVLTVGLTKIRLSKF